MSPDKRNIKLFYLKIAPPPPYPVHPVVAQVPKLGWDVAGGSSFK